MNCLFFVHVKFVLPNMESTPWHPEIFKLKYCLSLLLQNSCLFNPRRVIPKFRRARKLPPHPKSVPQPRHAKSPFYPSARNAGSTSRCQNRWGYTGNLPYISDKRVPKPWFPLPSPSSPFIHRGRQNPQNPTLLHRPPDRRPVGDSSPTMSSTTTACRPSSTAPDEDPSSISSSRRFSHPILHLQGAALTFPRLS